MSQSFMTFSLVSGKLAAFLLVPAAFYAKSARLRGYARRRLAERLGGSAPPGVGAALAASSRVAPE